jgi:hypothetical protein
LAKLARGGEPLPFSTRRVGSTDDFGVSWNGRLMVFQGSVYDTRTRLVVGKTPANAYVFDAWPKAGLVFSDWRNRNWLQTDDQVVMLPRELDINAQGSGFARVDGCRKAVTLRPRSGEMDTLSTCLRGAATPLGYGSAEALTPNSRYFISRFGDVVETRSGQTVGQMLPASLSGWQPGDFIWVNNRTFVIGLRQASGARSSTRLVSCRLPSLGCVRAGPHIESKSIDLRLFRASTR